MRTMCVKLNKEQPESTKDYFSSFSSRVRFRSPGFIFADVTESIKKFGSETSLLEELKNFNRDFFPQAQVALANSPWTAQLFLNQGENYFSCPADQEQALLKDIPLTEIHNFEGLVAWSSQEEIEDIITFFRILGFERMGDLQNFEISSFQQRWGKTGELLWKRLHGLDRQLITPIKNSCTLVENMELSFPISLRPFLLHFLENQCRKMFNLIKDKQQEATKLVIHLHCEYNFDVHMLEIVPSDRHLNLIYVLEQIERSLNAVDLINPVRKIDIEFFTSRSTNSKFESWYKKRSKDKFMTSHRLAKRDSVVSGYIPPLAHSDFEDDFLAIDGIDSTPEFISVNGKQMELNFNSDAVTKSLRLASEESEANEAEGDEITQLQRYKILSPSEQLLHGFTLNANRGRSYFLALNPKNEKVCICYDHLEQKHYLKGKLGI